jgi:hypothetical protein
VREAKRYGMKVSFLAIGAPPWANGGQAWRWAPKQPGDFANFVTAAAKRYSSVHHWMIWGEPSRRQNWLPLTPETRGKPLNSKQAAAPHLYARILDASYAALKKESRKNLVIGGNTFTTGDISPLNFIRNLKLPNGKRPRMDLYGHNPFTARRPDLKKPPLGNGFADFSDLDTLAGWLDRYLPQRGGHKLKIFISEWFLPTDHPNHELNFYVTRATQASWLSSALKIARRWSRISTLAWFSLYDDPPNDNGDEVDRGLIDQQGKKKPSYNAYRKG